MEKFTFTGFLLRLAGALALVLLTFNPSGHSYYHWVAADFPHFAPLEAVAGIALLAAWLVYITATLRSLGAIGTVIVLAFFAALVWLVASWGWLDPRNATTMGWVTLIACAVVLAIGTSWSHIRRRLTGQADVDEVDHR